MKLAYSLFATLGLVLVQYVSAAERNVPFSKLPDAVQNAARGVIGGAPVVRVIQEEEGESFYTVEYTGTGGRTFEIEISPTGKILEKGELVNAADTPDAVRKKIEEKTKGVVWLKVIKSAREGQTIFVVKFDRGGDNEGKLTLGSKGEVVGE